MNRVSQRHVELPVLLLLLFGLDLRGSLYFSALSNIAAEFAKKCVSISGSEARFPLVLLILKVKSLCYKETERAVLQRYDLKLRYLLELPEYVHHN